MAKKLLLAACCAVIAVILYLHGEALLAWLRGTDNAAVAVPVATLLALFPVIPYPLVGGVIGAAYGPAVGGIVTWAGSTAASLLMFALIRYGFREWGDRLLRERPVAGRLTKLFERHAFLAILFARMLPFVPSVIVNSYAALSRVAFLPYAVASALGKIPAMLLFATAGDQLLTAPRNAVLALAVYGVFLGAALLVYRRWFAAR